MNRAYSLFLTGVIDKFNAHSAVYYCSLRKVLACILMFSLRYAQNATMFKDQPYAHQLMLFTP